jgi:hypothetical protein
MPLPLVELGEARYFLERMPETASEPRGFRLQLERVPVSSQECDVLLQKEFAHRPGCKKWWVGERERIRGDQRMVLFNDKRVEALHIRPVTLVRKWMSRCRKRLISATVSLFKTGRGGDCARNARSLIDGAKPSTRAPPAIQWRWYFDELSGIDVVSACEEQLGKLRAIVDECEQRFQA